jgi:hypothetical protein
MRLSLNPITATAELRYTTSMQGIRPMYSTRLIAPLSFFILALTTAGAGLAGQLSHFPSPHQPWTTREYVDFYFAHYNGNRALPHLRAGDTRRLFQRIVDRENVLRITTSSMSDERKRAHIAMILATMGEIRAAYNYAVFVGEPLQEELTRIQSFTLFLIDAAIRLEGRSMRPQAGNPAWRTTIWNIIGSLSEREIYSDQQIASLSSALDLHYPQLSSILSDDEKHKFHTHIGELAAAESNVATREAHLRLLRTVLKY